MNPAPVCTLQSLPSVGSELLDVQDLYRCHHRWLQGWLCKRVGCSQQAADLAQDTFMRLLQQRDVVLREPRSWLATVAHGLMVNQWRRRDIERAYLQELEEQDPLWSHSAEQQALVVDTLLEIDAMLASLPAKVRLAFLAVHLEGLTYRQVAEQLGVSERMVKKYMAQAMLACLNYRDL